MVWASAIEKRHSAIERTDVFPIGKAHEDEGRGDAFATQSSTKRRDHDLVIQLRIFARARPLSHLPNIMSNNGRGSRRHHFRASAQGAVRGSVLTFGALLTPPALRMHLSGRPIEPGRVVVVEVVLWGLSMLIIFVVRIESLEDCPTRAVISSRRIAPLSSSPFGSVQEISTAALTAPVGWRWDCALLAWGMRSTGLYSA